MKTKTRVLSLVMTLAIILSSMVIVIPTSAADPESTLPTSDGVLWTTKAATAFAGGSGTKDDPYKIANAEQLALLSALIDGLNSESAVADAPDAQDYYELTADIDHEWVPIGGSKGAGKNRFQGDFDGNGFTIKNMVMTHTNVTKANERLGLFGYSANSADGRALHDFNLENAYIKANYSGGVVMSGSNETGNFTHESSIGLVAGKVGAAKQIKNINATGIVDVTVTYSKNHPFVGGFLGTSHACQIINCTMNGEVKLTAAAGITSQLTAGGFMGPQYKSVTFENCTNNANVTLYAQHNTNCMAGGFMPAVSLQSENEATGKIVFKNCVNNGNITYTRAKDATGTSGYNQRLGGIVGALGRGTGVGSTYYLPVEIINCINTGLISVNATAGSASYWGPIVGYAENINNTNTNHKLHTLKIDGCFVPVFEDNDPSTQVEPYVGSFGGNASGVVNYGKVLALGEGTSSDVRMAVDVTLEGSDAVIRVSKDAVDTFLACGFKMNVNYGEESFSLTAIPEGAYVTDNGEAYEFIVTPQDAEVSMNMTKTLMGKDYTYNAEVATWADFYYEDYTGTGAEADPFYIDSAAKLAKLSHHVAYFGGTNNLYFEISGEIDLAGHEWLPIGLTQENANKNGNYVPSGILYGDEAVIKNMTLTAKNTHYTQSFIGRSNWTISDLTFVDPVIEIAENGNAWVNGTAVVVGAQYSKTITNVHVKGLEMTGKARHWIGGIAAYTATSSVTIGGCSVEGTIDLTAEGSAVVGGILGRGRAGNIVDTVSNVDITVTSTYELPLEPAPVTSQLYVGGLIGITEANAATNPEQFIVTGGSFDGALVVDVPVAAGTVGVGGITGIHGRHGTTNLGALTVTRFANYGTATVKGSGEVTNAGVGAFVGVSTGASISVSDCISLTSDKIAGIETTVPTLDPENPNTLYNVKVDMLDQAAIRLDVTGINFYATIDKALYDILAEEFTVELGLKVAHADNLADVKTIVYDLEALEAAGYGLILNETEDAYIFGGTVTGIIDPARGFVVEAYITVDIGDGIAHEFESADAAEISLADLAAAELADTGAQDDYYVNFVEEGVYSAYSAAQREILAGFVA